jgi:signal transduction histidine kinase
MKIRNKLTLLFTVLFAAFLLVFAAVIYYYSAGTREDDYYKLIRQEAVTKANLFLDAQIAPHVLQLIYKNTPHALFQEEVAIYDTSFKLLYHDDVAIDQVKETPQMIRDIVREGEIRFLQGALQVVGIRYVKGGQVYVITAAASDRYGYSQLRQLRYTLLLAFLPCVLLTLVAGRLFARKALQPVADMVDTVEEITATNMDARIKVHNNKDELDELAVTFNQMLDRLENSFDAQKQFVSNIAHELRTPLSSMVGELELALLKQRTIEEYQRLIRLAFLDARRLVRLSNGLLDLAKANYDQSGIRMKEVRLDELLLDARDLVLKSNGEYKVNILFEQEIENDDFISVRGNEYLLKVAFLNLMENGCKFSGDHQSTVAITYFDTQVILRFSDTGIGIAPEDLPHIFTAFYRGGNKQYAEGNGIGLSLTQKIIALHKGTIQVSSSPREGAVFTVELPHV